jgi:hypothetical protein
MPITQAQYDILEPIVDADANLVGANLELANVPDYDDFSKEYGDKFKRPSYDSSNLSWSRWENRKSRMWGEIVNKSLLPDNIIGACVIGGFTLAALKAGAPVMLSDLFKLDGQASSSIPLDEVKQRTQKALRQFTGMNFDELRECQRINDSTNGEDQYIYNERNAMVINHLYRKSKSEVLAARRAALKAYLHSIIK